MIFIEVSECIVFLKPSLRETDFVSTEYNVSHRISRTYVPRSCAHTPGKLVQNTITTTASKEINSLFDGIADAHIKRGASEFIPVSFEKTITVGGGTCFGYSGGSFHYATVTLGRCSFGECKETGAHLAGQG